LFTNVKTEQYSFDTTTLKIAIYSEYKPAASLYKESASLVQTTELAN